MMNDDRRASPAALLLILLLAAMLRAYVAMPDACIRRDGVWFVEMARKLGDDPVRHMQIETKQPGFSWLLRAAHGFGGDDSPEAWQVTGTLLAGIAGVGVCALVYLLTLRLFDRRTAFAAGVFAACWPQGVQLSADVLSDMPHLAIYLGAMAIVAGGVRRWVLLRWLAAGGLAGVAFWFRLEALGLLPAIVIWSVLAFGRSAADASSDADEGAAKEDVERRDSRIDWRSFPWGQAVKRSIGPLAIFLVAFAAVAGPFVLMARVQKAGDAVATIDRAREVSLVTASGVDYARAQIVNAIRSQHVHSGVVFANVVAPYKLPGRMAEEWARSSRYVFAALFLASLFLKTMPRGARPLTWLCAFVALFQVLLVAARVLKYGELSSRYLLVPIVLTIPWAASAFVYFVEAAIRRTHDTSRYKFIPIWSTGFILALSPMLYYALQPIGSGRLDLRRAGEWLAENAKRDDIILGDGQNLSQVRYYADRIYPHRANWQQLQRDASESIRDEAMARIRPALFITMIDKPEDAVDAESHAEALARRYEDYRVAKVFHEDKRPVIVLQRR